MTMQQFQRALCDMIASPLLCRLVRARGDETLVQYELSPRERRRIASVARQRGMETCCTLYRSNRITPIYTLLPLTCFLLGESLASEVELFWRSSRDTTLQFQHEVERFGRFLRERMDTGAIHGEYLREVTDFEVAFIRMSFGHGSAPGTVIRCDPPTSRGDRYLHIDPSVQVVFFRHEPACLLDKLSARRRPDDELPTGEYCIVLARAAEDIRVLPVDLALGRLLESMQRGDVPMVHPCAADALVLAGIAHWSRPTRAAGRESLEAT